MTTTAPGPGTDPGPPAQGLPIAEVAARAGVSPHTLRYYERAGLLDAVPRSPDGRRRYAAGDLDWLAFLLRLRETGMSIAGMQRFARLRRDGDASTADRLALLTAHRADLDARIARLLEHRDALDTKISHYRDLLAERSGTEQP